MTIPHPTPIYRILHIDNLQVCLQRGGFYASNQIPDDGLIYKTIHNCQIQDTRHNRMISCGPRGTLHDYVPFYFGPRSPMLFQLHTGRVDGYNEGQQPLIYMVSTVQAVQQAGLSFVFSDGHGIAAFTDWYDDLGNLDKVDWTAVYARYWHDTVEDMDRQRRKQAEFLIYQFCPWSVVQKIGVLNQTIAGRVETILGQYGINLTIEEKPDWYY
jgi:hypothetical protein